MSFVQPKRNPTRLSAGIGVAILFHVLLVWALMNGLAQKAVKAFTAPIETVIVEEVKPPPPPPKVIELPPPPQFAPPPPAYVPPPEVQVQAAPAAPTITTTTTPPPVVAPPSPAPPAPVAAAPVEAPRPAPSPVPVSASVACSNYSRVMGDAAFPRAATRLGLEEGEALIQFTLTAAGEIRDVKAVRASHAAFAENSIRLVQAFKCAGRGSDVPVQVSFTYRSE